MKKLVMLFLFFAAGVSIAQVLTTAQTSGKGGQAIMLTENRLTLEGISVHVPYVMYVRGLAKNFDLYVLAGDTHITGEDQSFSGLGGNLHLIKAGKFDISLFSTASTGLHRRSEAATALLDMATIVSYQASKSWAFYSGLNSLVPVGAIRGKLFTPASYKVNIPVGTAWTKGKYAVFAEIDLGAHSRATGIAIARSF